MRVGHPSTRRLLRWLDGDEPRLDSHLATCEHCAERLERLEDSSSHLRQPLLELLEPPPGLEYQLRTTIDDRLQGHEELTLFSELFGLPIRAVRVMTTTTPQGGR